MRRLVMFAALSLVTVLTACQPDSPPQLHDVVVTGVLDERLTYLYGEPRSFAIEGRTVELSAPEPGATRLPLAVAAALRVDGEAFLRSPVEPPETSPVEARRVPLTTDLLLRTRAETSAVLYFDGNGWFLLGQDDPAGLDTRVTPRPRSQRLRGLGALTLAEADALADELERVGDPLVVAVLADPPRRSIDGLAEYRVTALHVQRGLDLETAAFRPAPRTLQWEVIARGSQAIGFERPAFRLLRDASEFLTVWNQAHGAVLNVPPLPAVDFARETVLAVFMGTRPTGGYAIEVLDATLEGGDLYIDLRFVQPGADSVTTQALTSPWAFVRVLRGGISAAWFRDPSDGRLYAVARRSD
jgi:hypothetical protein